MKTANPTAVKFVAVSILCLLVLPAASGLLQAPESDAFLSPDSEWVQTTLSAMALREKIGQLIQVRVRGEFLNRQGETYKNLLEDIRQNRVGGVVLFAGNIYESAYLLNEIQGQSKVPLLVSADFERGASFRIADTTSFPWTMAIGATGSEEFAYREGEITAREARALGVHWIFAPVVDVNNNPGNPVINIRSYGEDPQLVARLGAAFIRGARSAGVLTTAKHFPGHGDTATDTHIGLAVVPSNLERLNSVELVPFRRAIEAGVDAVMTAHVAVPQVTGDAEIPATLSKGILTGLLRDTLHFKGLVVTDAMEMGGITNRYWCGLAAVRAIEAGADIVLLPTDTAVAINEIERAVERGDIPVSRIDESAAKVLRAKGSVGLDRNRTVSFERLAETVASPFSEALAQEIADRSITVVKDQDHILPVDPARNPEVFSLVLDSGLGIAPGLAFRTEMREMYPSMVSEWANALITKDQIEKFAKSGARSDLIVCSTFARLSSGRDISALPEGQQTVIRKLIGTGRPVIWIAFGNPYVLERFPKIGTYLCTFSDTNGSQRAAARAVSGAIAVSGKMPVSIPGHAQAGDGLEIPKLEMQLNPSPDEAAITSSKLKENISQIVDNYIKSGTVETAQILAAHRNSTILHLVASGIDSRSEPERFLWLSGSYHFSLIVSAMLATESGNLLLDAPVRDYLPEYKDADVGNVPVSDLLIDISVKRPIQEEAVSNDVLVKEIVSRVTGMSLDRFLMKRLFQSMHGNFNSVSDMAWISQSLLNDGIYQHRRIFKPDTIARFTDPAGTGKALGWMKPDKTGWTGRLFSPGTYGWMDSKGSLLWIDPKKDLFIILMAHIDPAQESFMDEMYEHICRSILDEIKTQ